MALLGYNISINCDDSDLMCSFNTFNNLIKKIINIKKDKVNEIMLKI